MLAYIVYCSIYLLIKNLLIRYDIIKLKYFLSKYKKSSNINFCNLYNIFFYHGKFISIYIHCSTYIFRAHFRQGLWRAPSHLPFWWKISAFWHRLSITTPKNVPSPQRKIKNRAAHPSKLPSDLINWILYRVRHKLNTPCLSQKHFQILENREEHV